MPNSSVDSKPSGVLPPAPGRVVDLQGRRSHIVVRGGGSPVVVLEAGTWDFSLTWSNLLPDLASLSTAVAYDRAGLGWSEPSGRPRMVEAMVDELRSLLHAAELPAPYLLVGHSFGGLIVRLYAHLHPREVFGLVLIDSAHEDQLRRAPDKVRAAGAQIENAQLEQLTKLGELVSTHPADEYLPLIPAPAVFTPDVAVTYRTLVAHSLDGMIAELAGLEPSREQMRQARITSLGDVPLVVLAHGEAMPMGVDADAEREYEALWQSFQRDFASLSSRGELEVVAGATHMIHHERPSAVVGAVSRVLGR